MVDLCPAMDRLILVESMEGEVNIKTSIPTQSPPFTFSDIQAKR